MLGTLWAYKYIAATATLDKWHEMAKRSKATRLRCIAEGLIWHDRYLCGDAERGRKWK